MIDYRETQEFAPEDLESLFKSVSWLSGNYPGKLARAMKNASTVISAWDGDLLVGLVNALDDGVLTAYAHYLLVRPAYQGQCIGRTLIDKLKAKYKEYLYLILVAEQEETVMFYEKLGFKAVKGATPVQILNASIQ